MLKNQNFHPLDLPLSVVLAGWLYRRLAKRKPEAFIATLEEIYEGEDRAISAIFHKNCDEAGQSVIVKRSISILRRYQNALKRRYELLRGLGVRFVGMIPFEKK